MVIVTVRTTDMYSTATPSNNPMKVSSHSTKVSTSVPTGRRYQSRAFLPSLRKLRADPAKTSVNIDIARRTSAIPTAKTKAAEHI